MRKIKFRVRNTVNGSIDFVSLEYLLSNDQSNISTKNISDDLQISQYTGLKDKNGVEIYEGDIVDCYWLAELGVCDIDCQHKGVVRFVDCRFEISFSDKAFIRNIGDDGIYSATELELICMSHDDDFAVEYEVVGNIYENPELLGEGDD